MSKQAYVFPGQGSQFPGMGQDLYENSSLAKQVFEQANDLLGFRLTDIMFEGSEEELKQTNITQPSIFLHSVAVAVANQDAFKPAMAAGHSLGEISAITACGGLSLEAGLNLVKRRAEAMQKACEMTTSTMAAILGLEDEVVINACAEIKGTVVAANFNSPGQVVISGELEAVEHACERLKELGAKRAIILPVGGAFHSPVMEPARAELELAINETTFTETVCPIYQNVTARSESDPEKIKQNLIDQLTAPVLWTQTMLNMLAEGVDGLVEVGPGKVLQGLVKKVDRKLPVSSL